MNVCTRAARFLAVFGDVSEWVRFAIVIVCLRRVVASRRSAMSVAILGPEYVTKSGIRQPIPGHISRIVGTELEFRSVRVSLFRLNLFHGSALSAFAADSVGRNKSF
jgi:hypothetical protein